MNYVFGKERKKNGSALKVRWGEGGRGMGRAEVGNIANWQVVSSLTVHAPITAGQQEGM